MRMNNLFIILTLCFFCCGASWSKSGSTWSSAENSVTSPAYPWSMGVVGRCRQSPGTSGNMISLTDRTSNSVYYTINCNRANGYYLGARNPTEVFILGTGTLAASLDEIEDSIVAVFESNTSKKLYVNGTLVATMTNNIAMSSGANDFNIFSLVRLAGTVGNFAGVINNAWYCGAGLDANDVSEMHSNKHDKDYIRQLCARKKAQLLFYPMTDMYVVSPGEAGGLGATYEHTNGYMIKDLGEGNKNAELHTTGLAFITGTFDIQN